MRLSSIAACLFLGAAAVLPFRPWADYRESPWALEMKVGADHAGLVQVYFDLGAGMSEEHSVVRPVGPGAPALVRFPLPCGVIKMIRLDPLDRDGHITISEARIADGWGRTNRVVSPGQFRPLHEIDSMTTDVGVLTIGVEPGHIDPQTILALEGPLEVPRPSPLIPAAIVAAVALAVLFLLERAWLSPRLGSRERLVKLWRHASASPGWALLAAALLGTAVANYPVIFMGRGIVTPNMGAAMLYGVNPWIPGAETADVVRSNKADVGALLWHHVPLSSLQHRALFDDGELPLWNRYDSAGTPLLGQGQSCFGDVLQVIPILAGGSAGSWELKFLLAKWTFAFAIGLCVWRSFRSLPVALASAVSASFFGFFVYRVNHPAIFSECYAPWILYCWIRISDSDSARRAIFWMAGLFGASWIEMCSGTAKEAYMLLVGMNFAGACVLLASERSLAKKAGLLSGAALTGLVFALASAPIWYTFLRALKGAYTSYNEPAAFQLQPGMILGLFDEAFFRPFQVDLGVINPSADAFVLIGVLWAAVRWRALVGNRLALGLLLASVPIVALVFGVVPSSLIVRIPFLANVAHVDNTLSCSLIVIFAVLAGFGWTQAWQRIGSDDGKREAVVVVALFLSLFAVLLGTAQAGVRSAYWSDTWGRIITVPAFIHGYGWSLVAASALLLGCLRSAMKGGGMTPALLVLLVVSFGALHWRGALQVGTGFDEYTVQPAHRQDIYAHSPSVDSIIDARDTPFRVFGLNDDLLPGSNIYYDLEGISGPDALVNPFYREFLDAAGIPRIWDWRYRVGVEDLPALKPVLDSLNVRFYLGYHLGAKPKPGVLKPFQSQDMDSYESTTAWPRAFFTDSAAVYQDLPQYCSWLKAGDGRPFAAVERGDWLKLTPAPRVSGDLGTRKVNAATNYRLTGNSTTFTVNATGPGFIVLTEAYEKDNFHLTVNGEREPYFRINHAFKGIYVDRPGTYEVSYSYYPRRLMQSLECCGAGFALLAAGLAVAAFKLRPAPGGRLEA